jgi:hypothetical protein
MARSAKGKSGARLEKEAAAKGDILICSCVVVQDHDLEVWERNFRHLGDIFDGEGRKVVAAESSVTGSPCRSRRAAYSAARYTMSTQLSRGAGIVCFRQSACEVDAVTTRSRSESPETRRNTLLEPRSLQSW